MYCIGVDIGGMSVKVGLVNEKGKIIQKNVMKTAPTFKEVVKNISIQINELLSKNKLKINDILGIGIGSPGIIDSKNGVIKSANNLHWENKNIFKELKKYFNTKICISNDANVATLAEAKFGSAKGANTCVMFTIGTGIGGGIILNKKLYEGGFSMGAELGHTTIVANGKKCSCGKKGCLEVYASATALISQTKSAMKKNKKSLMWKYVKNDINKVDGKTSFECAKLNDKTAKEVVDKYIMYLSEGVLSMLNIFRPDVFILGGGISAQGKYLIDKVICLQPDGFVS
ncbi:MAG: ROK family protein, partial [Clostridia bacterium]|nr:ROK family protein [Clostridia bacterium]